MRTIKKLGLLLFAGASLLSCSGTEVEPLDEPYVHIMINELTEITVNQGLFGHGSAVVLAV